jgi:chemotaxis response regulator CheB
MARAPKPLLKRAKRRREASPAGRSRHPTSAPVRLVVGIGTSAGGLQAFKTFFAGMPADSGMAFVLVQHLDPQHLSMMAELVGAATTMPVVAASDGDPDGLVCTMEIPVSALVDETRIAADGE